MAPTHPCLTRGAATLGSLLCLTLASVAAEAPPAKSPLTYGGDVRVRYERDWDSQNGSGVARDDRDRLRARVRASLGYQFSSAWSVGARARTGNRDSQQSPHLTFHSSDHITDDFEVGLDRYYIQYKQDAITGWAGRNTTPFWQQNEMVWDEDVTPTGAALSYDAKRGSSTLTTTAGAFYLPDGLTHLHGRLVAGQVKYSQKQGTGNLTVAGTLSSYDGKGGAKFLRNRNGVRGYLIGVMSAQWSQPLPEGRPLTLGVDLIRNFENYSATDALPFSARHTDQTDGWVASAFYGSTKNPGDWQLGWLYAKIQTFAVNASYAQDDWARFGSATQSDLSDIKGHEFRGTYVVTKAINVQVRLFLVDAITSVQDGKRVRVDLNWKF